jgi:hypothetical protein
MSLLLTRQLNLGVYLDLVVGVLGKHSFNIQIFKSHGTYIKAACNPSGKPLHDLNNLKAISKKNWRSGV